jgi:hypothetical protein
MEGLKLVSLKAKEGKAFTLARDKTPTGAKIMPKLDINENKLIPNY